MDTVWRTAWQTTAWHRRRHLL